MESQVERIAAALENIGQALDALVKQGEELGEWVKEHHNARLQLGLFRGETENYLRALGYELPGDE